METKMKNKMNSGVVVAVVASKSNPRRSYKIRRVPGPRRALTCPCLAFRFAEGRIGSLSKRCRHMDEAGL
jgi:hypothetical protein